MCPPSPPFSVRALATIVTDERPGAAAASWSPAWGSARGCLRCTCPFDFDSPGVGPHPPPFLVSVREARAGAEKSVLCGGDTQGRAESETGVWVSHAAGDRKIGAVGVRISRGIR